MSLRSRYRWYQFGNRLQVFFLGLLLGVVLSGGFFLLKLDDYVKDFALNPLVNQEHDEDQQESTGDETAPKPVKPKPNVTNSSDETEHTDVTDSTDTAAGNDSLGVISVDGGNSEIVLRKNELLGEKVVTLVNLDGTKAIDSIRSKEAGINEETAKSLTIEFWQSPLNSKGYTMSRSRLVLFGFAAEEQVALYKLNNYVLMKTPGGVFRLENTADFRQMERVTDEALLAKLP